MNKALLVMDYMNELIHPEGKFKARGYVQFENEHQTLTNVIDAVKHAREKGFLIIYVKFGFTEDYKDLPKNSPLFAKAKEFKAVLLDTWATEFHACLDVRKEDKIIVKQRISPFYGTDLDAYLRTHEVDELLLCGVSTDLVVQSCARDAHDRDYKVIILADCCVAGNKADHENSLETLKKFTIVGRRTYEILTQQPEFVELKKVNLIVVSKQPIIPLLNANHFLVNSPKEALNLLKENQEVIVAGGGMLNTAFMVENLVDEIYLDIEPILLGEGIPFFNGTDFERNLKFIELKKINDQVIQLHYHVIK